MALCVATTTVAGLVGIGLSSGVAGATTGLAFSAVVVGAEGACAVTTTGHVYCWGAGGTGELGNGATTNSSTPVEVKGVGGSGSLSTVTSVGVGYHTACAVTTTRHVYCWGSNATGAIGNNTTANVDTPVEVKGVGGTGLLSTVTGVSVGNGTTCAATSTSHAYCWGDNYWGELGNNTTTSERAPVEVVSPTGTGALSTVTSVSVGDNTSCALTSSQNVYCWGHDQYGAVGNGKSTTPQRNPVEVVTVSGTGILSTVTSVSAGTNTTCARTSAGHVYCWGYNSNGQLGNGATSGTSPNVNPVEVEGVGGTGYLSTATSVTEGTYTTCAVTTTHHVDCWGVNGTGQIGNATTTTETTPVEVVGVGNSGHLSTVATVSAGRYSTCSLTTADHAYCWGSNGTGQLGDGNTTPSSTPVAMSTPATKPAPPTGVGATAGATSATVSWTAPTDGGSAITGYTVTSSPGARTCTTTTATSCTVTGLTNGTSYTFTVTATSSVGTSTPSSASSPVTPGVAPSSARIGYREVGSDGGNFAFGKATFDGSMVGRHLNAPIVGMAATPTGIGYWEVASDGGIFTFGSAEFYGSMGRSHLNAPVVGMAATPTGGGYWEVASDGGVFAFGDATSYGSMGGSHLNAPIVGMAATPTGNGYWEVASDGEVFAFGDAMSYGSMGGSRLNAPIVGMAATPTGNGYWEVASDGGIFAFGNAKFDGSMGGSHLNAPIVGMARVPESA